MAPPTKRTGHHRPREIFFPFQLGHAAVSILKFAAWRAPAVICALLRPCALFQCFSSPAGLPFGWNPKKLLIAVSATLACCRLAVAWTLHFLHGGLRMLEMEEEEDLRLLSLMPVSDGARRQRLKSQNVHVILKLSISHSCTFANLLHPLACEDQVQDRFATDRNVSFSFCQICVFGFSKSLASGKRNNIWRGHHARFSRKESISGSVKRSLLPSTVFLIFFFFGKQRIIPEDQLCELSFIEMSKELCIRPTSGTAQLKRHYGLPTTPVSHWQSAKKVGTSFMTLNQKLV